MIVIKKKNTINRFILEHADDIIDIIRISLTENRAKDEIRFYELIRVGKNVYDKFPTIVTFKNVTDDDYKYIGKTCMDMLVQVLNDATEEDLVECGIDNEIIYKN